MTREAPGGARQTEAEPLPPPSSKRRGGTNKRNHKRRARPAAAAADSANASFDTATSVKTILSGTAGGAALGEAGFGTAGFGTAGKEHLAGHLAGGTAGADDSRRRTNPSRSARRARIRRKMAPLGPQPGQPDAASSSEIELVCMNVTSLGAAGAPPAVPATDHVGASVSPQMRGRFAVASIQFALVLAVVLWALSDIAMTQREGIEYFIKMDCNRIGSSCLTSLRVNRI